MFAVPNGAFLFGNKLQRVRQWKKLKAEGAVEGVSDLFITIPNKEYHGFYIEVKSPTGTQSKEQKEFQKAVEGKYKYSIIRSLDQFIFETDAYLANT